MEKAAVSMVRQTITEKQQEVKKKTKDTIKKKWNLKMSILKKIGKTRVKVRTCKRKKGDQPMKVLMQKRLDKKKDAIKKKVGLKKRSAKKVDQQQMRKKGNPKKMLKVLKQKTLDKKSCLPSTSKQSVSHEITESENYDSDENIENKKPIPSWAYGPEFKKALIRQQLHPTEVEKAFKAAAKWTFPDLSTFMGAKNK